MSMPVPTHYTAAMVRALPDDGRRHETVRGTLLVTPAPSWPHQRALLALLARLRPYVEAHGLGEVLLSPADLVFAEDILVQPDLFVVPREQVSDDWASIRCPSLVVEILSPSTARADRGEKRRLYQRLGVPEYWAVDLAARQVEVWTPAAAAPRIERDMLRWAPGGAGEAFVLPLAEILGASKSS